MRNVMAAVGILVAPSVENDEERKFRNSIPCAMHAAKFGSRPLLDYHAVMLPILENERLGLKVNFAPGRIPLGEKRPQKCI